MLAEAEGMPAAYQHLRVRLRIEQTRLLSWGQQIGIVEELLDQPSRALQLNRNLIIDVLLEIQAIFKNSVKIEAKYDATVPIRSISTENKETFDRRFPKGTNTILIKVLRVLEKAPDIPKRLQWAMIKQDEFQGIIEKLITYNNAVQAMLDTASIDRLQAMQHQTHMIMLQLNDKVDELKEISLAMQVKAQVDFPQPIGGLSSSSMLAKAQDDENATFGRLADFKARQSLIEGKNSGIESMSIQRSAVVLTTSGHSRSEADYQGKRIWIEWKGYRSEQVHPPDWNEVIEDRVQKLANLLGSRHKPKQFRAPQCLGYVNDEEQGRYGFVYQKPNNVMSSTAPVSLLDLIESMERPSLTKRIALATAIAQSVMYLHSVDWLHKGVRSDNVVFFISPGKEAKYGSPVLSGFDYARPDLVGEITERAPSNVQHDIYRHPSALEGTDSRSKKSGDIYSMGVVLVELAYWQRINDIVGMSKDPKIASVMVRQVREILLDEKNLKAVEGHAGEIYRDVVHKCIAGGPELGLPKGADETSAEIGIELQRIYAESIVGKLESMRV